MPSPLPPPPPSFSVVSPTPAVPSGPKRVSWAEVVVTAFQSPIKNPNILTSPKNPFPPSTPFQLNANNHNYSSVMLHTLNHPSTSIWTPVSYKKKVSSYKSRPPRHQGYHPSVLNHRRCARCLTLGHMENECRDPIKCLACNGNGHTTLQCRRSVSLPSPPKRASPSTVVQHGSPILASSSFRPPTVSAPKTNHRYPSSTSLSAANRSHHSYPQQPVSFEARHASYYRQRQALQRSPRHHRPRSPTPSSHRHCRHSHSRSLGRASRSRSIERERESELLHTNLPAATLRSIKGNRRKSE